MKYWIILFATLLIGWSCTTEQSPGQSSSRGDVPEYSVAQLQAAYAEGSLSVEEVVQQYLDRIAAIDDGGPQLNAIITVNPEALVIAQRLDEELKEGKIRGPLHGIPVVLKDNIDTHDKMPTTAGSRALAQSFPLQDSYVAHQLREAGAVIIGKANLSEWANFRGEMSSSGWSGIGGQTKNPYDTSRNPCGSSSGSGVAVAANLAVLAIGTETNGSIVCPAHANGVVGIKPTVGLVSRSGVIPISFTQDTPGPMARTVEDAVICLGALTGVDSADSKTLASQENMQSDYTPFLQKEGLQGKRIGWYQQPMGAHYKVDSLMHQAIADMEAQGAEIVLIDAIWKQQIGGASFTVMLYEYKQGLNEYFASLGPDAPIKNLEELIAFNASDSIELQFYDQRYLEMAQSKGDLSSEEYQEALALITRLAGEEGIDRVMAEHDLDAIVAPTGSPAWKTDWINGDHYLLGSSSPAAIAGYPNITVPMGYVEGLPVGMSIFGAAWSEPTLIEIAYAYEQATQHRVAPDL